MLKKFVLAFTLLITTFVCAIVIGAADTTIKDVWLAITAPETNKIATMIHEVRLPRESAAVVVGAALAVAGAIMQGMTRNPLADPGLIGLTAGANAALAIVFAFFLLQTIYKRCSLVLLVLRSEACSFLARAVNNFHRFGSS